MNARAILVFVAAALTLSACSLLLDFEPDGRPCSSLGECEPGFGCVDNKCIRGVDAGVDCSRCALGACLPGTSECLPQTCEHLICRAGYYCDEPAENQASCKPIQPGLPGQECFEDLECTSPGFPNRRCLLGAIQRQPSGQLRSGICVERCGEDGSCAVGTVCRGFTLGNDAGTTPVCLPTNTLTECTRDVDCARAQLVCTIFDHPQIGTLSACAIPVGEGADVNEACVRFHDLDGGGDFCRNGLCLPQDRVGSRVSFCGELCDVDTCGAASSCRLVPLELVSTTRYIPVCISVPTVCDVCTGAVELCGQDAPHCTQFGAEAHCLGECTPAVDGGVGAVCPPDFECAALDAGFRCVPSTGTCL